MMEKVERELALVTPRKKEVIKEALK